MYSLAYSAGRVIVLVNQPAAEAVSKKNLLPSVALKGLQRITKEIFLPVYRKGPLPLMVKR